jgi:alkanesulfonate monooxygenase SsuD/methylene tetrahydromethanopterin reductase-like flavin-dependent oxidoreductase (luciferase family)
MSKITFGWVLSPSTKDSDGARTLHHENEIFIQRLEGSFDTIWVEDHFQWNDRPVVECWTNLVYLSAKYPNFNFGPLVMGQSYRNPALTAKMFATLDWLTGGRMIAGIGAGWKEDEYHSYGWPFPPASSRIGQLEEVVQIFRAMWSSSPATFEGEYYSIKEAYCEPLPDPHPPLLIAGGGERLTLKVVAKYADWMNVGFCDAGTFKTKLEVLKGHCEDVGRDYEEIKKTYFGFVSVTEEEQEPLDRAGLHIVQGTPDVVEAELKDFIELGVEHFMIRYVDFPSLDGAELFLQHVMPKLSS